jgi:hypothetical protein
VGALPDAASDSTVRRAVKSGVAMEGN